MNRIYWELTAIFLFSLCLTGLIRHYALAKNILDLPNKRSSHQLPTPRGGGLAFVVVFLLALPVLWLFGFETKPVVIALMSSGLLVATLGFFDDLGHIAPGIRLCGHFISAAIALYWLGGMPSLSLGGVTLKAGWLLNVFGAFYLSWLLNLYNFMDGIDGLAAIELLTACLSAALFYWLNNDLTLLSTPLVLVMAVAGFLWWNFPPARIFMGDVGSGFLGLCLGILSIEAAGVKPQYFWVWLVLLAVFITDASLTLLYRLTHGYKIYEAHRSHAYQHAVHYLGGHLPVTLGILLLNMGVLLPIALLIARGVINGFTGLMLAYPPLIVLAVRFKAGIATS